MRKVTDPNILAQLNGVVPKGMKLVTDPTILAQLNEGAAQPQPKTINIKDWKPTAFQKLPPTVQGIIGAGWEVAKPLVEIGAAGLGAAPGIVTENPILALFGGGVGYKAGKDATREIDKYLGAPSDMSPAPLTGRAERTTGKLPQPIEDVLSGAEYTVEGYGTDKLLAGGLKAAGWAWAKLPSVSESALQKEAGQVLIKQTPKGLIYARNAEEAARIEREIGGGLQFTRGQATGAPETLAFERGLSSTGEGATMLREQQAGANQAVRDYFERKFPGETGNVTRSAERVQTSIQHQTKTAEEALTKEVGQLGERPDIQASGQAIRERLISGKATARKTARDLYDAIPNVQLDSGELSGTLQNIKADFQKSGDSLKDYPKGIINQIEGLITEKPGKASGLLDATGRPIVAAPSGGTKPLDFQELRGIRTQIREATQDALSGANPNHKLARRLQILQDGIENTINQLSNPEKYGEDVSSSFRKASAYYKEYDKIYRRGAVGNILRPGNEANGFRIADANVAREFVRSGKLDAADDFMRALGSDKEAKKAMDDYLSQDLLKSATDPVTGEVQYKKLMAWQTQNKAVLQKFGLGKEFSSVVRATRKVNAWRGLSENFDKSVAARMIDDSRLGVSFEQGIARAMTTPQKMTELMRIVQGDKSAEAGLQKAVGEYIMNQARLTPQDLTGNPQMSVAKMTTAMRKYAPALRELYKDSPEKLQALQTINQAFENLARSFRPVGPGGSDTAEKLMIFWQLSSRIPGVKQVIGSYRALSDVFGRYSREQVNKYLLKASYDPEYAETLIQAATAKAPESTLATRIKRQMLIFEAYTKTKESR